MRRKACSLRRKTDTTDNGKPRCLALLVNKKEETQNEVPR